MNVIKFDFIVFARGIFHNSNFIIKTFFILARMYSVFVRKMIYLTKKYMLKLQKHLYITLFSDNGGKSNCVEK